MTSAEFRALAVQIVGDGSDYDVAKAIAPRLGVRRQTVSYWLNGRSPVMPTAAKLVTVLADAGERELENDG